MPRPRTSTTVSPFQELVRRDLAALDPPVDLDSLVIDGRSADPPMSWRVLANKVNELIELKPPIGHPTLKHWYQQRLDDLGVSRGGPAPVPAGASPEEQS